MVKPTKEFFRKWLDSEHSTVPHQATELKNWDTIIDKHLDFDESVIENLSFKTTLENHNKRKLIEIEQEIKVVLGEEIRFYCDALESFFRAIRNNKIDDNILENTPKNKEQARKNEISSSLNEKLNEKLKLIETLIDDESYQAYRFRDRWCREKDTPLERKLKLLIRYRRAPSIGVLVNDEDIGKHDEVAQEPTQPKEEELEAKYGKVVSSVETLLKQHHHQFLSFLQVTFLNLHDPFGKKDTSAYPKQGVDLVSTGIAATKVFLNFSNVGGKAYDVQTMLSQNKSYGEYISSRDIYGNVEIELPLGKWIKSISNVVVKDLNDNGIEEWSKSPKIFISSSLKPWLSSNKARVKKDLSSINKEWNDVFTYESEDIRKRTSLVSLREVPKLPIFIFKLSISSFQNSLVVKYKEYKTSVENLLRHTKTDKYLGLEHKLKSLRMFKKHAEVDGTAEKEVWEADLDNNERYLAKLEKLEKKQIAELEKKM